LDGEDERWRREFLKRFAIALTVSVVVIAGVSYAIRLNTVKRQERLIGDAELHNVEMRRSSLVGAFRLAVSDILYLSDQNETVAYLSEPTPENMERLRREFVSFSQSREGYDQIRLLSEKGASPR